MNYLEKQGRDRMQYFYFGLVIGCILTLGAFTAGLLAARGHL